MSSPRIDVRSGPFFSVPSGEVELLDALSGPTLFRIEGRDRSRCRAFVALLHGDEPSSFRALHRLLRERVPPAVDLLCFVGAVPAAQRPPRFSHRMLPGRRDLNRCFRPPFDDLDGQVAEALLGELRRAKPEAIVDLHNNTGHNPAYGIGVFGSDAHRALASLFAGRYVLSNLRLGAIMEAFEGECPVVSIECGRAGDPNADAVAYDGILRFAQAEHLPPTPTQAMTIYSHPRRVTLKPGLTIAFAERETRADVTLNQDVDRHNFTRLDAGTHIGWASACSESPLEIRDHVGHDVTRDYFAVKNGALVAQRDFTPIMMTTKPEAVLADCLFYVVNEGET